MPCTSRFIVLAESGYPLKTCYLVVLATVVFIVPVQMHNSLVELML